MAPTDFADIRPLARGGMAELHLARMVGVAGVEKMVVVKRVLPEFAEQKDFLELFVNEARVAATLQHPNVVQTHEVGEDDNGIYLVMEYLKGADLRTLHKRSKRNVPLEFAVQIAIDVLAGLHYAHQKHDASGKPLGIVHCDVSPHNVFVTQDGAVKVLDFGVSKASSHIEDDTEVVRGKFRYMAPEQVLNAHVDPRTDVYAVGCMLYELLTGHRAHIGKGAAELAVNIVDHDVKTPRSIGASIPSRLEEVVMRSLKKHRNQRFHNAQDFQAALEDFCADRGLYPSRIRLAKWVTEHAPNQTPSAPNRTQSITRKVRTRLQSTPHAELRKVDGITVVQFHGQLNESFDGAAVGEQLNGPTVFDLHDVRRVTSFGIRSWLQMVKRSKASPLYFVRVPSHFVNQIGMVRALLGGGKVLSFSVPFTCKDDDHDFEFLLSGPTGRRFIDFGDLPDVTCPENPAHKSVFDDDHELYDVLNKPFEATPPLPVTQVVEQIDARQDGPAIEKSFDGDVMVVSLRGHLSAKQSWSRVFQDIEGSVRIDFRELTQATHPALEALAQALCTEEPTHNAVELVDAPGILWVALRSASKVPIHAESLMLDAVCGQAGCSQRTKAKRVRQTPDGDVLAQLPCDACSHPLDWVGLPERIVQAPPTWWERLLSWLR